jgi:hypothetical protein
MNESQIAVPLRYPLRVESKCTSIEAKIHSSRGYSIPNTDGVECHESWGSSVEFLS